MRNRLVFSSIKAIALALAIFATSSRAVAQGANQTELKALRDTLSRLQQRTGPDALQVGSATRAFLSAGNADLTAKFSAGAVLSATEQHTLELTFGGQTPLKKGADDATLFDIQQTLTDGTTASLGLVWTGWGKSDKKPSDLIKWCQSKRDAAATKERFTKLDCNDFDGSKISPLGNDLYKEFLSASGWQEPWVIGLNASAGRAKSRFLDAATYQADSIDRVAYKIGINVGHTLGSSLLTAGLAYQQKYKARDTSTICVPGKLTGSLRCDTEPIGIPKQKISTVLELEYRGYFNAHAGASLQANYLFQQKVAEFALPVYFIPSDKGALIGGIGPSFTTDGNQWGLRVFVGATGFGLGSP